MTENKRFTMVNTNLIDDDGLVYYLIKKDGKDIVQVFGKHTATKIINELNALHEENSLLKDIITDIVVQLDANHTSDTYQMTIPINRVIYNELNRRLKETSFNEELRRFLDE